VKIDLSIVAIATLGESIISHNHSNGGGIIKSIYTESRDSVVVPNGKSTRGIVYERYYL
jgi:hypothetical protein